MPGAATPTLTAARRRLLAETHNAIVATLQPDGRPQLTPNWYLWDGATFWVSTLAWTVKVRNVRRDPRVTMCIDSGVGSGDYVQVFGRADLIEGDVRERTLDLIRKYRSAEAAVLEHWERIRQDRVLIRVHPERWQWRFRSESDERSAG